MIFPVITHLDQVREAIEGKSEFIVAERDGYFVVNYNVSYEDTFPPVYDENGIWNEKNAILRECRGIMFDMNGNIISRPFNKFFNIDQLPEVSADKIDLTKPHVILDKLDGSMIRAVKINGVVRLCTKMGLTDEAKLAEDYIMRSDIGENLVMAYHKFIHDMVEVEFTPIFEFCSRKNQIILDYPEDQLVLTAMRVNKTGYYVNYAALRDLAAYYGIPFVQAVMVDANNAKDIVATVREWKGVEGIVIRFDDGLMVKVKCEEYCIRHQAKDGLLLEKNLIKTYLEEKLDDILPLLDESFRKRVDEYIAAVNSGILKTRIQIHEILNFIHEDIGFNRAKQASWINDNLTSPLRGLVFSALDGRNVRKSIVDTILKNTSSLPKLDTVRELFGATWA